MSKNQNPNPILPQQNYTAALSQANSVNPLQQKLQDLALRDIDLVNQHDYTKLPSDIFFRLGDTAQRNKQREVAANSKVGGIFSLGGARANPTALASQAANLKAHQAEDDSAQYEQAVSEGAQRAYGMGSDLAGMEQARRLGVLGSTVGPYSTTLAKPKEDSWFDKFLKGISSGASTFATAGA